MKPSHALFSPEASSLRPPAAFNADSLRPAVFGIRFGSSELTQIEAAWGKASMAPSRARIEDYITQAHKRHPNRSPSTVKSDAGLAENMPENQWRIRAI